MTNYDQFLSSAAVQMKESAIRRMGTVSAASRDIISFAPGYPAPDTFPWIEFSQIAAELLNSKEPGVLQYGPTRGYRPLLEAIGGIMSHRGISCATEELLVTTGSQQGLDLVARVLLDPGDVVLVELSQLHRSADCLSQRARQDCRRAPGGGRRRSRGARRDLRAAPTRWAAGEDALRRAELPESDRASDRPRQTTAPARMGWAS